MRRYRRRRWHLFHQRTFEVDDGDHRIETRVGKPGQYRLEDADGKQVATRVAETLDATVTFTVPRPGTYTLYRMESVEPR